MSQWTKVEGDLHEVKADLSHEPTPCGSEGGSALAKYMPRHWMWNASLRDRGEEDAPSIRDWFADLCRRTSPTKATLEIDNGDSRYQFEWDAEANLLRLEIPPLYREAIGSEVTQ
jgi:hypothetical protein